MTDHSIHLITINKLVLGDVIPNLKSLDIYKSTIINEIDNFTMIDTPYVKCPYKPNKSEIRLALDMINQTYPLWRKCQNEAKKGFLEDIFKFDISVEKLDNLKPFKKIVKKELISTHIVKNKPQVKIIKTIRRRNKTKYLINVKKLYKP
jgi:hypothetical protein